MANPKQKRSKSNSRSRRSNWKLQAVSVSTCPQCKKPRRPHFACANCGYYDGRLAVKTKETVPATRPKG
ncbi:MAG: 50S ribosomal protein L32 [Candidatus Eremiobacter antarcticus]|nr:50S ribosomal protein L32 [Candidatus Eremiobacteraeota bacterium]MBC5808974.1 50S ribosomal protein L32 [Candidatus Eremiobacteraeota bacterium]PZR60349.1 MAG: 50S ribosomal protein L32 [Candidatus Eremiobacter sp. RRmetagenome_bin22]